VSRNRSLIFFLILVVAIGYYLFTNRNKTEVVQEESANRTAIEVREPVFSQDQRDAVMLAIIDGQIDIVREALDEGMSPDAIANVPTVIKQLPFLQVAVRKNQYEIVKLLLDRGASLDVEVEIDPEDPKDAFNFPVIWEMIYGENSKIIALILDRLKETDQSYEGIYESLTWSVAKNAPTEIVKLLLDKGADPDYVWNANSPLIHAVMEDNFETLKVLVEAGADIDRLAPYGEYFIGENRVYIPQQFTALDCAIMWDRPEMTDYLRSIGGKEVYHF